MSDKRLHKLAFYEVYSLWFSHRLPANQSRYIHINSVRKFSALFNNSVDKCCLHSFYYIFSLYFHCSASILTVVRKRTDYSRNESSREHSLLGAKVPTGNFRSRERKYRRAKSWYPSPYHIRQVSHWCQLTVFRSILQRRQYVDDHRDCYCWKSCIKTCMEETTTCSNLQSRIQQWAWAPYCWSVTALLTIWPWVQGSFESFWWEERMVRGNLFQLQMVRGKKEYL